MSLLNLAIFALPVLALTSAFLSFAIATRTRAMRAHDQALARALLKLGAPDELLEECRRLLSLHYQLVPTLRPKQLNAASDRHGNPINTGEEGFDPFELILSGFVDAVERYHRSVEGGYQEDATRDFAQDVMERLLVFYNAAPPRSAARYREGLLGTARWCEERVIDVRFLVPEIGSAYDEEHFQRAPGSPMGTRIAAVFAPAVLDGDVLDSMGDVVTREEK